VRLTAGGKSQAQPLKIEMDPRVAASAADLRSQFELATRITSAMHSDSEALQQVKALRQQLQSLRERAGTSPALEAAATLEKKVAALEQSSVRFGAGGPDEVGSPSFTRLNSYLVTLLEVVEGADAKPTPQAAAAFADTEKSLFQQLTAWKEIQGKDVPALNAELQKAELPPVALSSSSR
jgi:hypothetical protein